MDNEFADKDGDIEALSSMNEFLLQGYDYMRPKRGDIREGVVMRIDPDEIIIDIGAKREGIVPSSDLEKLGPEAVAEIKVGDEVPVYVLQPESPDGDLILSLNLARSAQDWQRAKKFYEEEVIFEAEVIAHNQGGLIVPFGLIQGFVPASQVVNLTGRTDADSRMGRLAEMVGQGLMLKVIEVDRRRHRLILSERLARREWRKQQRERLLEELQEGETRHGTVSNICDFGAFVDLGGIDGLIHISELSWDRVTLPQEVLQVGDEVDVYVLRVDRERKRIALSLKRLRPDPWSLVDQKYEIGQLVQGTVTNVVKFGAFVRIEEGIEGLVHISELAEGSISNPRHVVKEGDVLTLRLISINSRRRRMGLSLKRAPVPEEPKVEETVEAAEVTKVEAAVETEEAASRLSPTNPRLRR